MSSSAERKREEPRHDGADPGDATQWLSHSTHGAEWRTWVSVEAGCQVTHFVIRPHGATEPTDVVLTGAIHEDGDESTCEFRFVELATARQLIEAADRGASSG